MVVSCLNTQVRFLKKLADEFALGEFSKFRVEQDKRFKSDFDAFMKAGENAVESIKNEDD